VFDKPEISLAYSHHGILTLWRWDGCYYYFWLQRPLLAGLAILLIRKITLPLGAREIATCPLAGVYDPVLWVHVPKDDRGIATALDARGKGIGTA
jgi:hypothetical protein